MSYYLVLVTTPGARVSEKLSKGLLQLKLAACVNRIRGIQSRYWWEGKIQTAREELLLIKTRKNRIPPLVRWVRLNHPYRVCEIVALPITGGNKPYLDWIGKSVG